MVVLDGIDLDGLDYIVKAPFNGSGPAGGDPLTENLNIWYEVGLESSFMPSISSPHCWMLTAVTARLVI